ncbi:hypothetical protein [Providencia sp. PROV077]|uniref:hypothetical protein n=1 Tax=Providencia sp. PROV077 TaxID=2949799 RepID=UPI00234B7C09|nr:hypothetical protein [Providencia sp. PROV077]
MSQWMNINKPFKPIKITVIKMGFVVLFLCLVLLGMCVVGKIMSEEPLLGLFFGFSFVILFIILGSEAYSLMKNGTPKLIEQGRYYTEECHILETDVEINPVYPHTHKLQCGPLIDYVDIKSYREAAKAYQDSLKTEDK